MSAFFPEQTTEDIESVAVIFQHAIQAAGLDPALVSVTMLHMVAATMAQNAKDELHLVAGLNQAKRQLEDSARKFYEEKA